MTASSGVNGKCRNCRHQNNEHNFYRCEVKNCNVIWKICQQHKPYMVRKMCKDHIESGPGGTDPGNIWMQGKDGREGILT